MMNDGGGSNPHRFFKVYMETYSISQLAHSFKLSRSTLLYYDRIGVLNPSARSTAGYRIYSDKDYETLKYICMYRDAGLPLAEIKRLLTDEVAPCARILEKRMHELGEEILHLRHQQHMVITMLKKMTGKAFTPVVNKQMWVDILKRSGMDEAAMEKWHAEFERRAPDAHYEFLLSLGIPVAEAKQIQAWAKNSCTIE